jgi:hypothetical protein
MAGLLAVGAIAPRRIVTLVAMVLAPSLALAQAAFEGDEFQVTEYTTYSQRHPAVAADQAGGFVVVWENGAQVFGRRFDWTAAPATPDLVISDFAELGGDPQYPDVAAVPPLAQAARAILPTDHDFVVVWQRSFDDGDSTGVFGRRFAATGDPLGDVFQANTYSVSAQGRPAIAMDLDGDFVVVWHSFGQDGYGYGIFGQRFSSSGSQAGSEFMINTFSQNWQLHPDVAMDEGGGFVVVWSSYGQDGEAYGIFGQRFGSSGARVATEFQVNTYTPLGQTDPAIAMDHVGSFVVVWLTYYSVILPGSPQPRGIAGGQYVVMGQRFDSAGATVGSELVANTYTDYEQFSPAVALRDDGAFLVVWTAPDTDYRGVRGQFFAADGAKQGELQINTYEYYEQQLPAAAVGDKFVVAWESYRQDGDSYGVFGQLLLPPSPTPTPAPIVLDADGDGELDPFTDGILILRWMFGFSDTALVSGAVDVGDCTRCTAAAIDGYLDSVASQLDIDGDGEVDPFTDGILILRWMFGFSDTALVSGAVDLGDCTRCTAGPIEAYLGTLDG